MSWESVSTIDYFLLNFLWKKHYKNHTPKPTRPIDYTLYNTSVPIEKWKWRQRDFLSARVFIKRLLYFYGTWCWSFLRSLLTIFLNKNSSPTHQFSSRLPSKLALADNKINKYILDVSGRTLCCSLNLSRCWSG